MLLFFNIMVLVVFLVALILWLVLVIYCHTIRPNCRFLSLDSVNRKLCSCWLISLWTQAVTEVTISSLLKYFN